MSGIAIVGAALRFPGASSVAEFWREIDNGRAHVRATSRWNPTALARAAELTNAAPLQWLAEVENTNLLDGTFWELTATEIEAMDPQQRLALTLAWEAIEDASLDLNAVDRSKIGVFLGNTVGDFDRALGDFIGVKNRFAVTGSSRSILANRISYALNLGGPSLVIDTACSSSLVAVHLAAESLRTGECDVALVGGVNLVLDSSYHVALARGGFLSSRGACHAFGSMGDGYVRGEGGAIIVLKRLSDARASRDRVLATVLASASAQDGRSNGLTAPSSRAQERLIRRVLELANVPPADVGYVEAHGTGTALGDPIEASALGAVFAESNRHTHLLIGSVKSNLGHLEGAAGIAGLMKAVECVRRGRIAPTLHAVPASKHISFERLRLRLVTQSVAWPTTYSHRVAGVSSFGFGGSIAHVLIGEPPKSGTSDAPSALLPDSPPGVICISAKSESALRTRVQDYVNLLTTHPSPGRVIRAATERTTHLDERVAAITGPDLVERLNEFARSGRKGRGIFAGRTAPSGSEIVFVFSGHGGQWVGMATALADRFAVFRDALEEVSRVVAEESQIGASTLRSPTEADLHSVDILQCAVFTYQVALCRLLASFGVTPHAVLGHSLGEVAAACVAGALSLKDAARVVSVRGRLIKPLSGRGGMLHVELPLSEASKLVAKNGKVCIGASNSPHATVLSGDHEALAAISKELRAASIFCKAVKIDYAAHSQQLEPLHDELVSSLKTLSPTSSPIFVSSSSRGQRAGDVDLLDAEYWWSNLRSPVMFGDQIVRLGRDGMEAFIEIGPHPGLSSSILENLESIAQGQDSFIMGTSQRGQELDAFLRTLCGLHARGYPIKWSALQPGAEPSEHISLPPYPWQMQDIPVLHRAPTTADATAIAAAASGGGGPTLPPPEHRSRYFDSIAFVHADAETLVGEVRLRVGAGPQFAFLREHRVRGEIIVPATVLVELVFELATYLSTSKPVSNKVVLEDVVLLSAIIVDSHDSGPATNLQVSLIADGALRWRFVISSRPDSAPALSSPSSFTRNAEGALRLTTASMTSSTSLRSAPTLAAAAPLATASAAAPIESGAALYDRLKAGGLDYGPSFRRVRSWRLLDPHTVSVDLSSAEATFAEPMSVTAGAATLDASLHASVALVTSETTSRAGFIPVRIRRLTAWRNAPLPATHATIRRRQMPPQMQMQMQTTTSEGDDASFEMDVVLTDETGESLVAEIEGLEARSFAADAITHRRQKNAHLYELHWAQHHSLSLSLQQEEPPSSRPRWFVVSDSGPTNTLPSSVDVTFAVGKSASVSDYTSMLGCCGGDDTHSTALFVSGDRPPPASSTAIDSVDYGEHAIANVRSLLTFVRALSSVSSVSSSSAPVAVRLAVITRRARATAPGEPVENPGDAILHGFVASVLQEHPELVPIAIDVDELSPATWATIAKLLAPGESTAVTTGFLAIRNGEVLSARLRTVDENTSVTETSGDDLDYVAHLGECGRIDSLHFEVRSDSAATTSSNDVEVEIRASALNFRDVLVVIGGYPGAPSQPEVISAMVGSDFAGVVTKTGSNVHNLRPGDSVFGLSHGRAFARYVTAPADNLMVRAEPLAETQAAALPTVCATAVYALDFVARIRAKETVLIHSAAGGTGRAAVAIALAAGCEVIATAGTPEKRAYLRSLGIQHVFDSRSLDWADEIRKATNGRGVDVVLNALAGEALRLGVSLLAPGGRFVEIGKRDVYTHVPIDLYHLRENRSLSVVALDDLLRDPRQAKRILRRVGELANAGVFSDLPIEVFPLSELSTGFERLARGRQIGKVVFSHEKAPRVRLTTFDADPEKSYLVTGGTGALGQEVVRLLAEKAPRSIVVLSRTPPKTENNGVVRHVQGDVRKRSDVERAASIACESAPLGGIFHVAGVAEDGIIETLDDQKFQSVLETKILGALHCLHVAKTMGADELILFSSIAALIGSPGQAHYSAANAFLDALVDYPLDKDRQGQDGQKRLRISSIAWGPWLERGLAARTFSSGFALKRAKEIFSEVLMVARPKRHVAALHIPIEELYATLPRHFRTSPLTRSRALDERIAFADESGMQASSMTPPSSNTPLAIQTMISELTMTPLSAEKAKLGLVQLGFDSLMVVSLRQRLESRLGVKVSTAELLDQPTVTAVIALVERRWSGKHARQQPPGMSSPPPSGVPSSSTMSGPPTAPPPSEEPPAESRSAAELRIKLAALKKKGVL